ncbi:UNVERIFIED_CONTAM: hypothetical protein FKN15_064675 [Acipenser sinensis]
MLLRLSDGSSSSSGYRDSSFSFLWPSGRPLPSWTIAPPLALDWQAVTPPLAFEDDPCLTVTPQCISEADRLSLEALRHIHKQLDDDNNGGIEVDESVEVSTALHITTQPRSTEEHNTAHYYTTPIYRGAQHCTLLHNPDLQRSTTLHITTQPRSTEEHNTAHYYTTPIYRGARHCTLLHNPDLQRSTALHITTQPRSTEEHGTAHYYTTPIYRGAQHCTLLHNPDLQRSTTLHITTQPRSTEEHNTAHYYTTPIYRGARHCTLLHNPDLQRSTALHITTQPRSTEEHGTAHYYTTPIYRGARHCTLLHNPDLQRICEYNTFANALKICPALECTDRLNKPSPVKSIFLFTHGRKVVDVLFQAIEF